jgi:hypothetical protein
MKQIVQISKLPKNVKEEKVDKTHAYLRNTFIMDKWVDSVLKLYDKI